MLEPSPSPTTNGLSRSIAVLDLGSNSFHMLIAQSGQGELRIVDKLRDPVRLASGLDRNQRLSSEAQKRALACLARFGQRIRDLPHLSVRVVGTNTLRRARNGAEFRARAQEVLHHPIDIISGEEEARLIYQGVAFERADPGVCRLVVDIGGGSTETIVGIGPDVLRSHSLFMGCVTYSRRFFPDGKITEEGYREARTRAELEVRAVRQRLMEEEWALVLGASGTCNAISEILAANGWTDGEITRGGLKKLRRALLAFSHFDDLSLPGLRPDRMPVIAGGTAILEGIFRSLDLKDMRAAMGALREGLLVDLVGRMEHHDIRHHTVDRMAERYGVDPRQAARVTRTVEDFIARLEPEEPGEFSCRDFLTWAAQLHEIGLTLSYTGYHRHGAYIVANSHMPGFSRDDQALLGGLLRSHRRTPHPELTTDLRSPHRDLAPLLCALLRVAVVLNRSRSLSSVPPLEQTAPDRLKLTFPAGWLEEHALTREDLRVERAHQRTLGFDLELEESDASVA